MMRPAVFRLLFCVALFAMWMGYLSYLVATRPTTSGGTPLVLSVPQIQTSQIDIVAKIDKKPTGQDTIEVVEVLYSKNGAGLKPGDKITVSRLDDCRPVARGAETPDDWTEPGEYLVPLRPLPGPPGRYTVAPIPTSPGFATPNVVRIYPATREALAQYSHVPKPGRED